MIKVVFVKTLASIVPTVQDVWLLANSVGTCCYTSIALLEPGRNRFSPEGLMFPFSV